MTARVDDFEPVPAEAMIDSWLSGDRSSGTHGDLCNGLRRILGIRLSNQEIDAIFREAIDHDRRAAAIAARLLAGDGDDRCGDGVSRPR